MGLVIDQPRVDGASTSNDGNTARQFFQQYNVSANIINMDADLMKRLTLPLGMFSEEAQEATGKVFITFRENFARK